MIESSYCRKPVIASNCPNGPEEFLSYGKGGYLFSNNNLQELEQKLTKFLNDEEKNIMHKVLLSKKNSRNFSMFNHFIKLNQLLQSN